MVVCSQPSKVEHIIRKSDLPIIGLQYFTEFQKSDPSIRPTYVCNLCESKCDMNTVLSHATGFKHRMNYFKENHPDIYSHMNANTTKKKSEQNASAEEFALDCMKRDGQGKIKVKLEIDHATETLAANLLSKSGITVDTFLEDLKNKPGPPVQEKKKQRITPDILAKQESYGGSRDRGHNKRASESHYDFPPKHPRGHRDNYGNVDDYNNQPVFDYNHKGNQRGYSGGENQFTSYNQPSSQGPQQMGGRHGDQRGPQRVPLTPGNDTDNEDKELFKEFLEWKRQKKMGKNNQSNVQAETSQNDPPTQTEKKAPEEVPTPEASSNSAADMMFALSQTMIKTEEDAAMALQVSNALTQALLQYRLKNVPKELTAALSTAAGQTSSVQTRTKESKPSSSKGARKPPSTQSVQNTAPTPVPAPAPVPYPQGISSTSQQLSRPLTHTTTESSLDSRLQYMNPVNPSFPNNSNPVPAPQYPGSVPNTQYPGYSFYEGQYQPQAPEGYQWGYSAVNQGEAPPPLPPSEDLPKPPPENQTY